LDKDNCFSLTPVFPYSNPTSALVFYLSKVLATTFIPLLKNKSWLPCACRILFEILSTIRSLSTFFISSTQLLENRRKLTIIFVVPGSTTMPGME
jgi:cellulose synthase/poly-beta-1,6-N-acetylglucosamine synthase-like glycosyltransferase